MISKDNDKRAERRRRSLRRFMAEQSLMPAEMARRAGLPSANTLYNFLNGRSSQLSQSTYEKLAEVVPGTTVDRLTGAGRFFESSVLVVRDITPAIKTEYQSSRRVVGEICVEDRHSYSHGYKCGYSEGLRRSLAMITGRAVSD